MINNFISSTGLLNLMKFIISICENSKHKKGLFIFRNLLRKQQLIVKISDHE